MKRPLIQKSNKELLELIELCHSNSELKKISTEVTFRKKYPKKQKELQKSIKLKKAELSKITGAATASGSNIAPPVKERPGPKPETAPKAKPVPQPKIGALPTLHATDPQNSDFVLEAGTIRKPEKELINTPKPWSPDNSKVPFAIKGFSNSDSEDQKHIALLSALVWELRNNNFGARPIQIVNGKRSQKLDTNYAYAYVFKIEDIEAEIIEGAQCKVVIGSKKIDANIISFIKSDNALLTLGLSDDVGSFIETAGLIQDMAAFYETLCEQLKAERGDDPLVKRAAIGINKKLAMDAIKGVSQNLKAPKSFEFMEKLNSQQASAVKKSFSNSISYIWGPPGTGKTETLGVLLANYITIQEKTLVASNTNQAVDQILLKICRLFRAQKKEDFLERGLVVRIGKIANNDLEREFGDFVIPEKIAERLSKTLTDQMNEISKKITAATAEVESFEKKNKSFEIIKKRIDQRDEEIVKIKNINATLSSISRNLFDLEIQKKSLDDKIDGANKRSILGKMFGPNIEDLKTQANAASSKISDLNIQIKQWSENLVIGQENLEELNQQILKTNFDETKYRSNKNAIEEGIKLIQQFQVDQERIRKEIDAITSKIIADALVIGTTVTKAFMSPAMVGKFTNVIIDEASMVIIPSIYFTAGLAEKRVTISGDFRQLPPIVQSRHPLILDQLGFDVFTVAEVQQDFVRGVDRPYCATLEVQYRMDAKICNLISEIGYGGRLKTAQLQSSKKFENAEWLNKRTIIIDTSTIGPFMGVDGNSSRSNVSHAAACKSLVNEILKKTSGSSIGICAPYKAQIKLLQNLINEANEKEALQVGTVHTYQGDEKEIIIFDTVESYGAAKLPGLSISQVEAEKSNLLTVAVSRAKSALIIIANLKYLDTKLTGQSYLRKILYMAQEQGMVLDVKDFLSDDEFEAYKSTLSQNFEQADLGLEVKDLDDALVREKAFFPLLNLDFRNAKNSVVIYSGFYGPNRVEKMILQFQELIQRGVKIKCVIPPPNDNGSLDEGTGRYLVNSLEKIGIGIEYRHKIHQKAVLIDDETVWFGSLNPLSFSGSTQETMLRLQNNKLAYAFAENFGTHIKYKNIDSIEKLVEVHNPSCAQCGSKTIAKNSRYGKYLQCVDCGETKNFT